MFRRSLSLTLAILLFLQVTAQGIEIWAPGGNSDHSGYPDTNKTGNSDIDGELCWAVASSNLLEWGKHRWSFCDISGDPLAGIDPELAIASQNNNWYEYFRTHWTNASFQTYYALRWIFEGDDYSPYKLGDADLICPDCTDGASYAEGTYGLIYIDEPENVTVTTLFNLLNDYAVALSLDSPDGGHVVTCYGLEYVYDSSTGIFSGTIHFSDGDDTAQPVGTIYNKAFSTVNGNIVFIYQDTTFNVDEFISLAPTTVPTFTITPLSGPNGSISPTTSFAVEYGGNVTFTAIPDTGYEVDTWYINGQVFTTGALSITKAATEDMIIHVTFKTDGTTPSQILVAGSTNPDIFEFSMQPDDSQSLLIPVYNPGTSSTVVNVSKSGTASSWTSLESTSFNLASHELKKFQVIVDSPAGVAGGTYTLNISFNGIVQPLSIRIAALGDLFLEDLSPSSATIDGNGSPVVYRFDNSSYDYFEISEKYNEHADTYCSLTANQYVNANDYTFAVVVQKMNSTYTDLVVKMNNQIIKTIDASDVGVGSIETFLVSGDWGTLTNGLNVLSYTTEVSGTDDTPLWKIWDGYEGAIGRYIFLVTDITHTAYLASNAVNIPADEMELINLGYMNSARVYSTVISCSNDGRVHLYNNGIDTGYKSIDSGDIGDLEYWSLASPELDNSNLFAIKGDPVTEPVVSLSNLKLVITFNTNDPVLTVIKQPSSNRIRLGQQATVTVHIENTAVGSSTGYDTDLTDSLPAGLTLSSGMLNKSNIGKLNYEDTYTNTYTITANQVGHYTLPSARVDYETYDGDPVIDESMPVDLTVVYGQLAVNEPNVISPRLVNENGIHISAIVLDVDGVTPVTGADVYALVEKDFGDVLLWQTVYIVPMGWSQTNQSYIGITPMIQSGGNYRATIIAQKDWYDDGQSTQTPFYIHAPDPDIIDEGIVNLLDFSYLAARWMTDCNDFNNWCENADMDRSGSVDIEDLFIMARQWLCEKPVHFSDPALKAAIEQELGVLDPTMSDLLNLEYLYADGLSITDITGLGYATNLIELDLSNNQLSDISAEIGDLTNLEYLDLSSNNLTSLPVEIENLGELYYLNLNSNQFAEFPLAVIQLSNIDTLNLNDNLLTNLPAEIEGMAGLNYLYLWGNQLTDLPVEISALSYLFMLDLSYNDLTTVPVAISNLTNLNRLNLGYNHITSIPAWIGDLSYLERLYINDNLLTSLSTGVGGLSELNRLYLYNNQLTSIPDIGGLTSLEHLLLHNNQLTSLPGSITNLTHFTWVSLENNQMNEDFYTNILPLLVANNPTANITYDSNP